MRCKEINNLVMKYFDGNASELEREMIVKHNKECSRCAEEFSLLREAIDIIEEFPEVEVPVGFESRVMEGIKTRGEYITSRKIVAFWLVAVLGLMVFGWNMVTHLAIPFIAESEAFVAVQNAIAYAVNMVSGILRELIVAVPVLLGKMLVLRNILLRDYVTAAAMIVSAFMCINLFLIYRFSVQEN